MQADTFLLFAITTLIVVLTPGPAALAVTAQGATNGFRRTLAGIAGVASANVVFFALSALGIAAIVIASDWLFAVLKWLGVAYLVYLGIGAFTGSVRGLAIKPGVPAPVRQLFIKGFMVEFANPKALLYFAAILPQFLDPRSSVTIQIATMGAVTLIIDFSVYSLYAFFGQYIAARGLRPSLVKMLNRLAGGALLISAWRMARVTA